MQPGRPRRQRTMDLNFTPEELAFRDEIRDWVAEQPAQGHQPQGAPRAAPDARRPAALGQDPRQEGLARLGLAQAIRRPGLELGAEAPVRRGMRARRRAAHRAVRPGDGGAGDHGLRHARAAAALPARHRQRRGLVEPGLQRAGRGLGPGVAEDAAPSARATTTSSTARRPGPRSASTANGSSAWCAPATKASRRPASASC